MTAKEVTDMAKEYLDNASVNKGNDRERSFGSNKAAGFNGQGGRFGGQAGGSSGQWRDPNMRDRRENKVEDIMRKFLEGHKFKGREFCINYNLRDMKGEPKCKDRKCSRAHNCAFIPRGHNRPCGKPHPKFEHNRD